MFRKILLASALLASPAAALAQTRQPASITTIPTATPQSLYWLDNVGAWQNLPTASSTNAWTGTNTWPIIDSHSTVPPNYNFNVVSIGANPVAWSQTHPAAIQIGPTGSTIGYTTGSLNSGIDIVTNPGNIPYDDAGYHIWNYVEPLVDTYWSDQSKSAFNLGWFIDMRVNSGNYRTGTKGTSPNGSAAGFLARVTISNPLNPSQLAAGAVHNFVGGAFEAHLPNGDGGVDTTITGGPWPGGSPSITVASTAGMIGSTAGNVDGDGIYIILDNGVSQHFRNVAISGNTITFSGGATLNSQVSTPTALTDCDVPPAAIGCVYDAKGAVFAQGGAASIGIPVNGTSSPAKNVVEVTGGEINLGLSAGSTALYKAMYSLVPLASDKTKGSIIDTMLSLSAQGGAVGFDNGITFNNFNGQFPLTSNGGLMNIDKHMVPVTIGYGIDMSNATITGAAFAFSTTANKTTPDNVWSNQGMSVHGNTVGVQITGAPGVGFDTQGSTGTIAIRMGNAQTLTARNAAGAANLALLSLDASNYVQLGNATSSYIVVNTAAAGGIFPSINNSSYLGQPSFLWNRVYATTYYGGNPSVVGVACAGAPTASFASTGGIVTHC